MKKLSYYLKQHIGGYTLAILSMVAAVGLDLWSPQLKRLMVDDVILGGATGKAQIPAGRVSFVRHRKVCVPVFQGIYV